MILERCAEKVTILQYYFGYLPIIYDDFMYGADIWINLKIYVEYNLNKYIKAIFIRLNIVTGAAKPWFKYYLHYEHLLCVQWPYLYDKRW